MNLLDCGKYYIIDDREVIPIQKVNEAYDCAPFLFESVIPCVYCNHPFTTYYRKAIRKGMKTRPTKPGDLLLPTRVPEWSHVRGTQSFTSRRSRLLFCVQTIFAQQIIKKI